MTEYIGIAMLAVPLLVVIVIGLINEPRITILILGAWSAWLGWIAAACYLMTGGQ